MSNGIVCAHGTASSDTHAASLTGTYTASSDTHAASLTGSFTEDAAGSIAANSVTNNQSVPFFYSADITTTETTTATAVAITPATTTNFIMIAGQCTIIKITNPGTGTIRLKEGATVLASATSGSIANGNPAHFNQKVQLTNQTAAAHTYTVTMQFATTGGEWTTSDIFTHCVSDGHAANLTGTYTASSDTHAASLTGAAGTCL